jgi:hypothetical protein
MGHFHLALGLVTSKMIAFNDLACLSLEYQRLAGIVLFLLTMWKVEAEGDKQNNNKRLN